MTLDFLFTPTYSTKTIAITDMSTYDNDPPEVNAPSLEVSIPGLDTVIIPFVPGELNMLNSTILEITEEGESPLPDGVYVFRYSITPANTNFVEKTIFRVEKLQEKFDAAFIKLDLCSNCGNFTKQKKMNLDTINYFIQGAIAAANNCATDEATTLYSKAAKLLHNFTNTGDCCGGNYPFNFY